MGSNSTSMAECVYHKASSPGRLSRIHEVACYDPCAGELDSGYPWPQELVAGSVFLPDYQMQDPFTSGTTSPMLASHRRQSSPELFHPVNSEHSLRQRTCGIRTGSHSSGPKTHRENAISSSSLGPPKPCDSGPCLAGHPHRSRTQKSYSVCSTPASHFEEPSSLEQSVRMDRTTITQDSTWQLENSLILPSVSSSTSSIRNPRMESRSYHGDDIASPSQPSSQLSNVSQWPHSARSATALRTSSALQPFNEPTGVMTEPMTQTLGVNESDTWEATVGWCWNHVSAMSSKPDSVNEWDSGLEAFGSVESQERLLGKHEEDEVMTQEQDEMIHDLEQLNARRPFPCPDIQLGSPLDRLKATITSELDSTNSQRYSKDRGRQLRAQYHGHDRAPSEALSTKKVPHCFNHESLLVSSVVPRQVQVEELRELFYAVNRVWMRRLTLLPDLHSRCHALLQSELFERAVRTLRQFTRGIVPQTFEDIFAIMNFAVAAALLLHWQHDYYSWKVFFDDALKWQHAISSDVDKIVFLNAIVRWWLPEIGYVPLLHGDTPQGSLDCGDKEILSIILRSGEVFKVCIGFLDSKSIWSPFESHSDFADGFPGFERADISERNDKYPAEELALYARSRAGNLIKNITRPLRHKPGIEAFRDIVVETELLIKRGFLQNTREIEITLLTSARVSSKSSLTPLADNFPVEFRIL